MARKRLDVHLTRIPRKVFEERDHKFYLPAVDHTMLNQIGFVLLIKPNNEQLGNAVTGAHLCMTDGINLEC